MTPLRFFSRSWDLWPPAGDWVNWEVSKSNGGVGRLKGGGGVPSLISPEWVDIQGVVIRPSTLTVNDQLHQSGDLNIPDWGRGLDICHCFCQGNKHKVFPL